MKRNKILISMTMIIKNKKNIPLYMSKNVKIYFSSKHNFKCFEK